MLAAELVTSVTRSPRRIDIIRARLPMCAHRHRRRARRRRVRAWPAVVGVRVPPRVAGKTGKNFPETGNLYLALGPSVDRGAPLLSRGAPNVRGSWGGFR